MDEGGPFYFFNLATRLGCAASRKGATGSLAARLPVGDTASDVIGIRPQALQDCGRDNQARPPYPALSGSAIDQAGRALRARESVLASPQTLTKAALTVYKGSALESDAASGNVHEDSQLIGLLCSQLQRQPKADSCQMIVNVAQLLSRSNANVNALLATLPHILSGMQGHLHHEKLQECGLGLLGNLACGEGARSYQLALLRSGGLHHVVVCMQRHADHAGVQRNAYRCLRNLASSHSGLVPEVVTFLLENRVPHLVCFMLHRHIESARVQEQALACIWSFAGNDALAKLLAHIGAADTVLRVMARHLHCAQVQRHGCGTLGCLLDACDRPIDVNMNDTVATVAPLPHGRTIPAPAELAAAPLAAAVAHPDVAEVQQCAISLLAALARSDRTPELQSPHLFEALRLGSAATRNMEGDAGVICAACDLFEAAIGTMHAGSSREPSLIPVHSCADEILIQAGAFLTAVFPSLTVQIDNDLALAVCSLLSALCRESACPATLVEVGALHMTLRMAQQGVAHSFVFESACYVLRSLLSLTPSSALEAFIAANGIRITLHGMLAHRHQPAVQEHCASILWSCALQPVPDRLISPSSPDIQNVIRGMAKLPGDARVQRQLGGLLWALSLRPQHARPILKNGWAMFLTQAAASQPQDLDVVTYACKAMENVLLVVACQKPQPSRTNPKRGVAQALDLLLHFLE